MNETHTRSAWWTVALAMVSLALGSCAPAHDEVPSPEPTVRETAPEPTETPSATAPSPDAPANGDSLESDVLVAMDAAGITAPGPAETNFGQTALLSGEWRTGRVLVFAYTDPSLAPPRDASASTDLNGVTGSVVLDEAGAPSIRFSCSGIGYDVTALDSDANVTRQPAAATDAAVALLAHLNCG